MCFIIKLDALAPHGHYLTVCSSPLRVLSKPPKTKKRSLTELAQQQSKIFPELEFDVLLKNLVDSYQNLKENAPKKIHKCVQDTRKKEELFGLISILYQEMQLQQGEVKL